MTESKPKLIIEFDLNMEEINARIEKEFCSDTALQLSDENLINDYKECKSVIQQTYEQSVIVLP
jgi:hypothetical protein